VVLVSTLALGACTTDDHKLPNVSGTTSENTASLEATAKTYYDCMRDAGIDMELSTNQDGQLAIVHVVASHTYMQRDENTANSSPGKNNSLTSQMMEDFFTSPYAGPALIVDGVDHSTDYAHCLQTTGYDEQAAQGSATSLNVDQMENQVRGNNKWAACARENGWPDIKDSVMPTDVNSMYPMVILPITITEDQLRLLLNACPPLDVEQVKRRNDWLQSNPTATDYPYDDDMRPFINFGEPGDVDEATQAHIDRLNTILYDKLSELSQSATSQ